MWPLFKTFINNTAESLHRRPESKSVLKTKMKQIPWFSFSYGGAGKVSASHPASTVPSETGNLTNKTVGSISIFLIYFPRAVTLMKLTTIPHN